MSEAKKLLQMTPVVPEREWRGETLKQDPELEGFLDNRMVFTDISMNKESRVRNVCLTFLLLLSPIFPAPASVSHSPLLCLSIRIVVWWCGSQMVF